MSITIGGYSFDGPYSTTSNLEDRSGVYAILDRRQDGSFLVDVGESSEVKTRIENHDRKDCWSKNALGTINVAVYYTPNLQQQGRMLVEQKIRDEYKPSCGER